MHLLTPNQQETLDTLLYIQENPDQIQALRKLLAWEARRLGWDRVVPENIHINHEKMRPQWLHTFSYEELLEMASIPGALCYIDPQLDLCWRFKKTLYAGPVPVTLELFTWTPLPEDAEKTLRLLGKIQDEITPASITTVVLCER